MAALVAISRRRKIQAAAPVVRKYRRLRHRRCLRMEYKNLRSMLPGSPRTTPQLRKKVGVVDAAYQYICELQTALLAKFSTKGIPAVLAGVLGVDRVTSTSDIQALAIHLIQSGQVRHNHQQQQPLPRASSTLPSSSTTVSTLQNQTSQIVHSHHQQQQQLPRLSSTWTSSSTTVSS